MTVFQAILVGCNGAILCCTALLFVDMLRLGLCFVRMAAGVLSYIAFLRVIL